MALVLIAQIGRQHLGTVEIRRRQPAPAPAVCDYDVSLHDEDGVPGTRIIGTVQHRRTDGWKTLAALGLAKASAVMDQPVRSPGDHGLLVRSLGVIEQLRDSTMHRPFGTDLLVEDLRTAILQGQSL
jgi:hypothetical protein